MELIKYYEQEKLRTFEECVVCGTCAKECPVICHTPLKDTPSKEIQEEMRSYLENGEPHETVFTRGFSCMECFKCVDNCCPKGLNPMLVNEIIKWEYRRNNLTEQPYGDPKDNASFHRIIASILSTPEEGNRIYARSKKERKKVVFFAGCNVYFQPDKLLNALDIIERITQDYAFLPGLDFCCGNIHIYSGALEKADDASSELIHTLSFYHPQVVIFWCPTCLCRFEKTHTRVSPLPFKCMSFPQFLAQNLNKLPLERIEKSVTLHEACKSAFTGLDPTGARDVLNGIPGVSLKEMPRHGENTICCGGGAADFFPNGFKTIRADRLNEASQTKTDALIDVCHYCHHIFVTEEAEHNLNILNYVSLVAESLGIEREDRFKRYRQMGNLEAILKDAAEMVETSPFSKKQIREAVEQVFLTES